MVEMKYNAIAITSTGASYAMLGAGLTGQLTLSPEVDQYTGKNPAFGYTPFSNIPLASGSSGNVAISGSKRVTLPAGEPTYMRLWGRRNVASGTQSLNYSKLEVTPIRWAD